MTGPAPAGTGPAGTGPAGTGPAPAGTIPGPAGSGRWTPSRVEDGPLVCGLGGFDRSGGEVVLAGGDLDPDVDGGDLTLAVAEFGFLGAWDGGKG